MISSTSVCGSVLLATMFTALGSPRAQGPAGSQVPAAGQEASAPAPAPGTAPPRAAGPAVPATSPPGYPPAAYPPYPYPSSAGAPNGEYVAPMSQTTQPAYLPQSVALSGPRMVKDWRDGDPIPYGYHRGERTRVGMVVTGSLLFGIPYLYSTLIASGSHDSGRDDYAALWFPVFGPFIQMAKTDSMLGREALAIDGVLQATGAFLFIYGLAVPRAVLVRNDLASLTVAPMHMGRDGNGLGLVGIF